MNSIDKKEFKNRIKFRLSYLCRLLEIKPFTKSFSSKYSNKISRIYVINLDRKPKRWKQIKKELSRINTDSKETLLSLTRRFSAIDARYLGNKINSKLLLPEYSLGDQLTVEPNNKIAGDLNTHSVIINMTHQEIAVALSHIEIWKLIAEADKDYTLVLEDDVYFKYFFGKKIDGIWNEIIDNKDLDILFLSYEYAKSNEAIKSRLKNREKVRVPSRGIWQASGYVLSKKGAQKLLDLLPVFGPIDLWLNLIFSKLDVYIAEKPIIVQRMDVPSTNSYSIMPIFSKLGIYTGNDQSRFVQIKLKQPIFVFGPSNSGLTSIANALMILGYTCCHNLDKLPVFEEDNFWSKKERNFFNAYVNINSLKDVEISTLINHYPEAKFIYTYDEKTTGFIGLGDKTLYLPQNCHDKWERLCTFLGTEYPALPFPEMKDINIMELSSGNKVEFGAQELKFDNLPWIIRPKKDLLGIQPRKINTKYNNSLLLNKNSKFSLRHWNIRNDTFPSNLAIFSPNNLKINDDNIELQFKSESTSVRSYTSAAIATVESYLYGKFKVKLRPSNISGLITGIFLHRNSPHQEIDIEFLGKDTTKMLINVFFNPGIEGSKLEYGYRGTPVIIELGFDASETYHTYEIHWENDRIKWFVDEIIVYERVMYLPTPIPYLPMEFNINLWHSQSKEFAGKLNLQEIPASSLIKEVDISADY